MYRYSKHKIMEIADDYPEYQPEAWLVPFEDKIEQKADFDSALGILTKVERHLVFDVETWKVRPRKRVFSKMARYLNGELE